MSMCAPARNSSSCAASVMADFRRRAGSHPWLEDSQAETCGHPAVVGVGVRDVAGERDGVVDLEHLDLRVHLDGDSPLAHLEDLLGAACVGLALVTLAGCQCPVPQLKDVWW